MADQWTNLIDSEGDLRAYFADSIRLLASARALLGSALDLVDDAAPGAGKSAAAAQKELSAALRQALEAERTFYEWKARHDLKHGAGGALDLEQARTEIGRRLARLRADADAE